MQIDIRSSGSEITEILFWQKNWGDAHNIVLNGIDTVIEDGDAQVHIRSAEHAEYLIKALHKAIELGNWDE